MVVSNPYDDFPPRIPEVIENAPHIPRHATRLPVEEGRKAFIKMLSENRVVILVGETGSGKTTMIPQFIYDDWINSGGNTKKLPNNIKQSKCHRLKHQNDFSSELNEKKDCPRSFMKVACTQPRRIAAINVARRVAKQRKTPLGSIVGYTVRFDDQSSAKTRIHYMTDGILLRELQKDPQLSDYLCIILDEAHERTLHGDTLFGLLKDLMKRRSDLRLVVMSATLEAETFSKYWWDAPIAVLSGRSYPVTIYHTKEPQADYVEAAVSCILQVHLTEPPGDILCFLSGQEEIEDAREIIQRRLESSNQLHRCWLLTLYSALPYEKQLLVFESAPENVRKIILATNIAETSITVEKIKYVIDSGVVKSMFYDSSTGMQLLKEVDVSKAQAIQRAGRAGRTSSGKCFRLYTTDGFELLMSSTVPEILRCSLTSTVLQMKSVGITDVLNFDYLDPPKIESLIKAEENLLLLGAVDKNGNLSLLGRRLIDFPVEPGAAKALLAGKALGIPYDIVVVISMLSVENIFVSTRNEGVDSSEKLRNKFYSLSGDHGTMIEIFKVYASQSFKEKALWCESCGINYRQMQRVEDTVSQLYSLLMNESKSDSRIFSIFFPNLYHPSADTFSVNNSDNQTMKSETCNNGVSNSEKRQEKDENLLDTRRSSKTAKFHFSKVSSNYEDIRRALCYGFFLQTAFFNGRERFYQTIIGQQKVSIHPTSVLFQLRRKPPLILYTSVLETSKRYIKYLSIVREEWLFETSSGNLRPID